jgi:hypothetical protein
MSDQVTTVSHLSGDSLRSGAIRGADEGSSENGSASMPSRFTGPPAANRHRLPDERPAITHHFAVGGHEGYLMVGLYPNGQPGEIFIRMAREGSTIAGLMECFGAVVSVSLQHRVPFRYFARSSRTSVLNHRAGRGMQSSATRSRSWTISSAGWSSAFFPERNSPCFRHLASTGKFLTIRARRCQFHRSDGKLATRRPAVPAAL